MIPAFILSYINIGYFLQSRKICFKIYLSTFLVKSLFEHVYFVNKYKSH